MSKIDSLGSGDRPINGQLVHGKRRLLPAGWTLSSDCRCFGLVSLTSALEIPQQRKGAIAHRPSDGMTRLPAVDAASLLVWATIALAARTAYISAEEGPNTTGTEMPHTGKGVGLYAMRW